MLQASRKQRPAPESLPQRTGARTPPLRDLVESYAQDAGMEFLPKARLHEGLQVRADALANSCM